MRQVAIFLFLGYTAIFCDAAIARITATFHRLPTEDVIKNVYSFCVYQDSKRVIWACTQNGLARYDGTTVKVYRHRANDKNSLSSNIVRDIIEDKYGNLWIATINGGLDKLDTSTETFTHFVHEDNKLQSLSSNQIWSLYIDNTTLWIGTFDNGLNSIDIESETVTRYPNIHYKNGEPLRRIASLFSPAEQPNILMLGTDHGLYLFNKEHGVLTEFQHAATNSYIPDTTIWDIKQFNGYIWLATSIGIFKINTDAVEHYSHQAAIADSLPENNIRSIFHDSQKRIWLGSIGAGLINWQYDGKFSVLRNYDFEQDSIPHDWVWDVIESRDGMVWVATARGVASFNPQSTAFTVLDRRWFGDTAEDDLYARSVLIDSKENLWVGSNYGVFRISPDEKKTFLQADFIKPETDTVFFDIKEDSSGTLWIASEAYGLLKIVDASALEPALQKVSSDCCTAPTSIEQISNHTLIIGTKSSGAFLFDTTTGSSTEIPGDSKRLNITKVVKISDREILVGAYSGLYILDVITGGLKKLTEGSPNISGAFILDILPSTRDQYYVASDKGLFIFFNTPNNATNAVSEVNLGTGNAQLPVIFSITSNGTDTYWLGTGTGLVRYQPGKPILHINNYNGLPHEAFARGAAFYGAHTKTIYFGGPFGVTSFQEGSLALSHKPPAVAISTVNTKREGKDLLLSSQPTGDSITLTSADRTLSVAFTALDYLAPEKNLYAYKLTDFPGEWIETGTIGRVTFNNLDPGNYTLYVKARNANGIWSDDPATLDITVVPPWWQSVWAYIAYSLIVVLLLGWFVRYQNQRVSTARAISKKLQQADILRETFVGQLEEQVSKATTDLRDSMEALQIKNVELEVANKRAQDASQLKSRFLADMSHELRTPMNGILGFAELLGKTPLDSNQKDYVSTIRHSGKILLDMVGNVLDLSKIESGKISLDERLFSLRACLDETLNLLAPIAYEKGLELVCIVDPELPDLLLGDPARLRQIITNLSGNAIKFTQRGSVCVRAMLDKISDQTVSLTLAISDTGIGINSNEQSRLFHTFSQAHPGIGQRFGGSGLGLSISRGLAEAMAGTIQVQSTPGVGSVFTVALDLLLPDANSGTDRQNDFDNIAWQPDNRFAKAAVLLYDRHPLSIQANSYLLQSWGIQVVEVHDTDGLAEELRRNMKRPRYNACLCALTQDDLQHTDALDNVLREVRGNTPLLVLASTLSMDILCAMEVQWQAVCLAKTAGGRLIHNALSAILEEQPQFSRTSRDISEMQQDNSLGGMRILITDDNQANRELLRRILRHHGAHTSESSDGPETLQRLNDEAWDILLLDIHMPGMSGIDVARELRAGTSPNKQIPIIAVTANALPEMRDWALARGMDAYLVKPYTEEALLEALAAVAVPAAAP